MVKKVGEVCLLAVLVNGGDVDVSNASPSFLSSSLSSSYREWEMMERGRRKKRERETEGEEKTEISESILKRYSTRC